MNKLYSDEGSLKNYYAFPKGLLGLGLNGTDKDVYLLLLDRARLSGRSGADWRDEQGRTFLIYPIASLARDLGCCRAAVCNSLNTLEKADLIQRRHQGQGKANRIYVKLPPEDHKTGIQEVYDSGTPEVQFHRLQESTFPDPNKKERNKKSDIKEQQSTFSSYGTKTSPSAGPTLEEYERLLRSLARLEGRA